MFNRNVNFENSVHGDFDAEVFDKIENLEGEPVTYDQLFLYHLKRNIIWVGAFSRRVKPSEDYIKLISYLDLSPLECNVRMDGYTKYMCMTNTYSYRPNIKYAGRYNPFKYENSASASISRLCRQISRLLLLPNVLYPAKKKDASWDSFREYHSGIDYLMDMELTCPAWLSQKLTKNFNVVLDRFYVAVRLFLDIYKLYLYDTVLSPLKDEIPISDISLMSWVWIHPWKTKLPIFPHLHAHLEVSNCVYIKSKNIFIRTKPMVNEPLLKQYWAECLDEVFGVKQRKHDVYDAHFWYRKIADRRGLYKRLKYCQRRPVADLKEYYDFHPFNETLIKETFVAQLLEYPNRRHSLGCACRLKSLVGEEEDRKMVCPMCGEHPQKVGWVSAEDAWRASDYLVYWSRELKCHMIARIPPSEKEKAQRNEVTLDDFG